MYQIPTALSISYFLMLDKMDSIVCKCNTEEVCISWELKWHGFAFWSRTILAFIQYFVCIQELCLCTCDTNRCPLSPQDLLDYEVDSDEEWEEEEPGESLSHSEGVSFVVGWKSMHILTFSQFM